MDYQISYPLINFIENTIVVVIYLKILNWIFSGVQIPWRFIWISFTLIALVNILQIPTGDWYSAGIGIIACIAAMISFLHASRGHIVS